MVGGGHEINNKKGDSVRFQPRNFFICFWVGCDRSNHVLILIALQRLDRLPISVPHDVQKIDPDAIEERIDFIEAVNREYRLYPSRKRRWYRHVQRSGTFKGCQHRWQCE